MATMQEKKSPTSPAIPTRPPPPPPRAPDPSERHPRTDPPPPDDGEDREPASAPPRAPSKRDSGRHRVYRPTPPGGAPIVLDRVSNVPGAGRLTSPSFGSTYQGYWGIEVTR